MVCVQIGFVTMSVCVQIGLVKMWFVYSNSVGDDVVCVLIGLATMWLVYK